jgi:hypothetical protein
VNLNPRRLTAEIFQRRRVVSVPSDIQQDTSATANCFEWGTQTVNLTGHISELPYSGATFFVEHNGKRQVLVLELASPICVYADKEIKGEENIQSLQLEILTRSPPFNPKWLKGRVAISGMLVPSSDHHTKRKSKSGC